jgi:hypothetical protein
MDTKCISIWVDQTLHMPAKTWNLSQLVLTKRIPCQRGLKMYLNMCQPNPSHARENVIFFSACFDQTTPLPTKTQNISQLVFTKSIPCQQGHKMFHNICWSNTPHAREDSQISQHMLNKQHTCHTCWPNPYHANENKICISTCVD